jgi:hypothetical protein
MQRGQVIMGQVIQTSAAREIASLRNKLTKAHERGYCAIRFELGNGRAVMRWQKAGQWDLIDEFTSLYVRDVINALAVAIGHTEKVEGHLQGQITDPDLIPPPLTHLSITIDASGSVLIADIIF